MCYFTDELVPLRDKIKDLLREKKRVIAALDGRSAAGKSTAAQWLAAQLGGEVIHMDDFFLPVELRVKERLAQPGGNVHYERFAAEVIAGFKTGRDFSYRRFDCGKMDYSGTLTAGNCPLTIVEGAYSLHPELGEYYDIAVFFHVAPEEQKGRILARNGAEKLNDFTQRWIPMEEAYIAAFDVENRCDMVIGRKES